MIRTLIAAVLVLGSTGLAAAHPLDMGYLKIDSNGQTVTIVLDVEGTVAAHLIGAEVAGLDAAARAEDLANASYRMGAITTNAGACTWTTTTAELRAATNTLSQTGKAECPAGSTTLRWEFPFTAKLASTFQLLVKAHGFAGDHVVIVDKVAPVVELTGESAKLGLGEFVWSGVEHIGAAPSEWHDKDGFKLADGIDHIMFLLALLLGGGTLLQLLGIATGFTIGHSVTLALAGLDILRPPPSLIEPLIALTIALAAVEAFTGKFKAHRWKIATAFGFIHGFAFASALAEMDLAASGLAKALFGFNLGVELGQVAIILIVAPMIIAMYRYRPNAAKFIVQGAAAAIFIAGMYWFFERTFA
ncbi:MAG: HupE/UreJ family protein [Kofleriaceae bacterium]